MSSAPPPPPPPPSGGAPYGGQPYGGGFPPQGKPNNNLVWAILTTLFCCLPFGIVSIVYAAKVDGLWAGGDYAGAAAAADSAKKWAIISAAVAIVLAFGYFVVVVASIGGSGY
jgi:hypothetical protein